MAKQRILILGDSHTRCLSNALSLRPTAQGAVEFEIYWLINEKSQHRRGNLTFEDALKKISQLGPGDSVAISLLGTAHNVLGLIQHEEPFDFLFSGAQSPNPPETKDLIPYHGVWDLFEYVMQRNEAVRSLRDVIRCDACHLATPPPKEDNEFIAKNAKSYRGRPVTAASVSPAGLRLKLWEMEMRVLRSLGQKLNMPLIGAPEESRTMHGFLKPDFYSTDATHANAGYGELVLTALERRALSQLKLTKSI